MEVLQNASLEGKCWAATNERTIPGLVEGGLSEIQSIFIEKCLKYESGITYVPDQVHLTHHDCFLAVIVEPHPQVQDWWKGIQ